MGKSNNVVGVDLFNARMSNNVVGVDVGRPIPISVVGLDVHVERISKQSRTVGEVQ